MMDVAVFTRLQALAEGRVTQERLPQAPILPAVVYTVVSNHEEYSDDGHDGLGEFFVEIDAYGNTAEERADLMAQIKQVMRPSTTDCQVTGEADGLSWIEEDTGFYGVSVQFTCWQQT